jgi:hypothetical protein
MAPFQFMPVTLAAVTIETENNTNCINLVEGQKVRFITEERNPSCLLSLEMLLIICTIDYAVFCAVIDAGFYFALTATEFFPG